MDGEGDRAGPWRKIREGPAYGRNAFNQEAEKQI